MQKKIIKVSLKDKKAYINIGYKKIALADPLREVAWNILGYNPEEKGNIPYNDFKNCNLSAEVEHKFMGLLPYYTDVKITSIKTLISLFFSMFISCLRTAFLNANFLHNSRRA